MCWRRLCLCERRQVAACCWKWCRTLHADNSTGSVNCNADCSACMPSGPRSTHQHIPHLAIFLPRARVGTRPRGCLQLGSAEGRVDARWTARQWWSWRRCQCPIKRRRRAARPARRPAPSVSRDRFQAARLQLSPACRRRRTRPATARLFACRRRRLVYDLSTELRLYDYDCD